MEFYCSNEDTKDIQNIAWDYVGYVTLTSNESTEFKSRELKSANVPQIESSFVKLHLLENHNNALNAYNQVKPEFSILNVHT